MNPKSNFFEKVFLIGALFILEKEVFQIFTTMLVCNMKTTIL